MNLGKLFHKLMFIVGFSFDISRICQLHPNCNILIINYPHFILQNLDLDVFHVDCTLEFNHLYIKLSNEFRGLLNNWFLIFNVVF